MSRYRVLLSYDGTSFIGWQSQNNSSSVQEAVQACFSTILREKIFIHGASRTDRGVHAAGQVAHFDTDKAIDRFKFLLSANSTLTNQIRVLDIELASNDFHSQYDAASKLYIYNIHTFHCHTPWSYNTSTRFHSLDIDIMKRACEKLIGNKNFKSLANKRSNNRYIKKGYERTIKDLYIKPYNYGIQVHVHGDGFLYKMVRNITGLLIAVGRNKLHIDQIDDLLAQQTRNETIVTAPAKGLFLSQVYYNTPVFQKLTIEKNHIPNID